MFVADSERNIKYLIDNVIANALQFDGEHNRDKSSNKDFDN